MLSFRAIKAGATTVLQSLALLALMTGAAAAGCVNPTGVEAALVYNNDYHLLQFCNGTDWMAVGPVSSSPVATPSHAGYFALTATSWTGDLGGLSGADAHCLTELSATHKTWKGYATANANGQLTASKVHAFLCQERHHIKHITN